MTWRLLAGFLFFLVSALTAQAQPIRLHPDNPHYFLFRGQSTVLVTNGEHYGAVMNLDFDYVAYLDHLYSKGMNVTRIFSGSYVEFDGFLGARESRNTLAAPANRLVVPWARSSSPGYANGGNKFDLNTWDPNYFSRLHDFVQQASDRGIVVEMVLFSRMYDHSVWQRSPLYIGNNINGVGTGQTGDFLTLADSALVSRQLALTRKIVQELSWYDNVYFEIANEPDSTGDQSGVDWHNRMIQEVLSVDSAAHMIAVNYDTAYSIQRIHPAVSVNNIHYTWADDWIGAIEALDSYFPNNMALAFDESWPAFYSGGQTVAGTRVEAWEFLVGGGSVYSGLSLEYTTSAPKGHTGHDILLNQLWGLKNFMDGFNLPPMSPQKWLVTGVPGGARHRVLAEEGQQYAIYVHHGQRGTLYDMIYAVLPAIHQANLVVDLPAGTYEARWVDPVTGSAMPAQGFTHDGGSRTFPSPFYSVDVALSIRATGDTPPPPPPLAAPTGLTAIPASSSRIDLSWTASTSSTVTGYRIFRNHTAIGTSLTPSYQDTGLAGNTAYSYSVCAFDATNRESGWSNSTSAATLPTAPAPTLGNVLTLLLNEGTGSIVLDDSGFGNNGVLLNGPTWTTGNGPALNFDGVNDTLFVNNSSSINSARAGITVAAWVYRNSHQSMFQSVLSRQFGNTIFEHYYLGFEDDEYRWFVTTNNGSSDYSAGSTAPIGQWVHLAGTYDGSNVKLYVNGVLHFTTRHSGILATDFTGITIGANHDDAAHTPHEAFNGSIDDVIIFDHGLTAAEVAQLYQSSNGEGSHSAPSVKLRLNEGVGTTTVDSSGHGNNGLLLNGAAWTTAGWSGAALNFDGNNDTVYVPNSSSINSVITGVSAAAWVYRNSDQTGMQSVLSRQIGDTHFEHYYLGFENGRYRWFVNTTNGYSDITIGSAAPLGQWVHLVGTYDGSSVKLYVNGVLDFSTPKSGVFPADFTGIAIGASHNDAAHVPGEAFNGRIDEVTLYHHALTLAEINQLYGAGNGGSAGETIPPAVPAGGLPSNLLNFRLDEGAGTTVADSSGNGNRGFLLNGTHWASGQLGTALNFDGIDDYLYISNSPAINSVSTGITVAAWIHRNGHQSGVQSIVSRQLGGTLFEHYYLGLEDDHYRWFVNTSNGYSDSTHGSMAPVSGDWVHLAGTYDGARVKLYINGVLDFTTTKSGSLRTDTTGITVGASHNDVTHVPEEAFHGRIDEVRIYGNALTAAEVTQLYISTGGTP